MKSALLGIQLQVFTHTYVRRVMYSSSVKWSGKRTGKGDKKNGKDK